MAGTILEQKSLRSGGRDGSSEAEIHLSGLRRFSYSVTVCFYGES
jgi:hypothetical protein